MKNTKFRTIIVGANTYSWRFAEKIDIRPKNNYTNKLLIDFGWYDILLYANDKEKIAKSIEPKTITPKFVRLAIEFALNNQWDIEQKNITVNIAYINEGFSIDNVSKNLSEK